MADGTLTNTLQEAVGEAAKLPPTEQDRLAGEIMKAVQAERLRKRQALLDWIETSPLQGRGYLLREVHEEFKNGFHFPSDVVEQEE